MRLLGLVVIALNTLLLLFALAMAAKSFGGAGMIFTIPLLIIPVLNIATAFMTRKNSQADISGRGWIIFCNILVGLFGMAFLLSEKNFQPMLGIPIITVALASAALAVLLPHSRATKKSETDQPPHIENPQEPIAQKLLAQVKTYETFKNILLYIGLGTAGAGLMLFYLLPISAVCFLASWYFYVSARKKKYAGGLVALGIGEDEALLIADREYSSGTIGQRSREWWNNYYDQNRRAIDALEKEFDDIMINKYGVRQEYLHPAYTSGSAQVKPATLLYFGKKSAAKAAEDMYQSFVGSGEIGNPAIFRDGGPNSVGSTFNKRFFGAYKPNTSQKVMAMIMWPLFALTAYGTAGVFIGPNIDLFVPSDEWLSLGRGISAILAMTSVAWLIWARKNGWVILKKQTSRGMNILSLLISPFLLFFLYQASIVHGMGGALTEFVGTDESQAFSVTKDPETEKSYGGRIRHHMTAYCVKSPAFANALIVDEYCRLRSEHYSLLPDGETPLVISLKKSFFGAVLKQYIFSKDVTPGKMPAEVLMEYNLALDYLGGKFLPQNYPKAMELLRGIADKGYADAQMLLGTLYSGGQGVEKNDQEALKYLRLAADQGNKEAMYLLGLRYKEGQGVNQDWAEAAKWLHLSAEQGIAKAQVLYAVMLETGRGVEKNPMEAAKFYRMAADQGLADAQLFLGAKYLNGWGVEKNEAEALKFYRMAADQGQQVAAFELGIMYKDARGVKKSDVEAAKWFRLSAEKGFPKGQFAYAVALKMGRGVEKNSIESDKWLRAAAEQGFPDAQLLLGALYSVGKDVPQDYTEAVKWFQKAADQGNMAAVNALGDAYEHNHGVPQDYAEALRLYHQAADRGYSFAYVSLGDFYNRGEIVPHDYATAAQWYLKAAQHQEVEGQFDLGQLYAKGQGVSQNSKEAYAWFSVSADGGNKKAAESRDLLARVLSSRDLEQAKALAHDYGEKYTRKSTAMQASLTADARVISPHGQSEVDGSCPSALVNGVPCIGIIKSKPVSENQVFENKIISFLYLSTADLSGGWSESKINMEARKKYFTDEGWRQYQDYVAWHKKMLRSIQGNEKMPYHATAYFSEGSQKYTDGSGSLKEFSAKGGFHYAVADIFLSKNPEPFKIEVSFSTKDVDGAAEILIQKWKVALENPSQDSKN